jgi:hypothetical protein
MMHDSDKEKSEVFDKLHDVARPLYQMGHARRSNMSERYDSNSIRSASKRLLKQSMKTAHGVIAAFAKRAKKSP